MAVFAWRTRATPVLHVNTLPHFAYGPVLYCLGVANSNSLLVSFSVCPLRERRERNQDVEPLFFRVLSFVQACHRSVHPDRAGISLWRDGLFPMAKELFGTDGIRGVPGTPPLDDATLFATGRSLGVYLQREHGAAHVLIGMDTRESGPHIASLLAAGLAQAGATVAFAGVITTPGVACLVRQNDFQAGVVISASHNPFQDNGVKLFSHAGMKFPDSVEEEIEAEIFKLISEPAPANPPALAADESLDAEYLAFLRKRFIPGANLAGF